jgi:hypothetical protein
MVLPSPVYNRQPVRHFCTPMASLVLATLASSFRVLSL